MKVAELKSALQTKGLPAYGSKADLLERLQASKDPNFTDFYGQTALHWAAIAGNVGEVKKILSNPNLDSANLKDKYGQTPVMAAIFYQKTKVLRVLVAHPCISLDTDCHGKSLEEWTRARGFSQGVRILCEARKERRRLAGGQMEMEQNPPTAAVSPSPPRSSPVELEELMKKQEKLVEAAILEGEEKNQELLSKNEERVEKLRKEYQEKERRILEENKANVVNQRKKHEVSLALLLSKNEAELSKMMKRQKEEKMRESKKRKADQLEATAQNQLGAPECPVCLDAMTPPTRIFQCVNGHHVCESCKPKLNPALHCAICRKKIIGRATDMENFLQALLPNSRKA